MEKQFKEVEKKFTHLKRRFKQNKISNQEFKDHLKKLRLKDKDGKYWTIGAQTGNWYYFDGRSWIEAKPPTVLEGKAICIHCGFENDLEAETCAKCDEGLGQDEIICQTCGYELNSILQECPNCISEGHLWEEMVEEIEAPLDIREGPNYIVSSVNPSSFFLFLGISGLFLGIIFGAFAGSNDYFFEVVKILPFNLENLHGKLIGGVVFGLIGGILGFLTFGVLGFLKALFLNLVFNFIGGIKVHFKKLD